MKRLHVHVSVKDLSASIRFYRTWFDAEPIVTQPDYAKWMLEDPRVNTLGGTWSAPAAAQAAGCCVPAEKTQAAGCRAK